MEAVTDVIFRHVVARAGAPDLFFTEFTNATGWMHAGEKAIGGRLVKTDDEGPIVAQLWGADPASMAKLSTHCTTLGYDGIDINMGCPDSSAVKTGGGAGMIRTPELAYEMISAAKTSGLPVSVKTRLGYSRTDEWKPWLTGLLQQDVAALTIHLRTKKEMSKVPAHFELIPEIVALRDEVSPNTPLVINGDIRDRAHGLQLVAENPGVDGIMIGRGIFQNPFAFSHEAGSRVTKSSEHSAARVSPAAYARETRREAAMNDFGDSSDRKQQLLDIFFFHLDEYDRYSHLTGRPYETLKRFYKIYIRDFEGASELRDRLMHTTTTAEAREIIGSAHTIIR